MLQCGTSSPTGADTTQYGFGPLENTPSDNVYPAGSIVEARTSDNAYGQGHQFFITYKKTTIPADSAGGYSIFGHITSGPVGSQLEDHLEGCRAARRSDDQRQRRAPGRDHQDHLRNDQVRFDSARFAVQ